MAHTEEETEARQMAQLYLAVIRRAQEHPKGREVLATMLRQRGWTCTPPATKAAPKRRTGR